MACKKIKIKCGFEFDCLKIDYPTIVNYYPYRIFKITKIIYFIKIEYYVHIRIDKLSIKTDFLINGSVFGILACV